MVEGPPRMHYSPIAMDVELIAITPAAEGVIEQAARTCYQSRDRASEESAAELLPRLLRLGHESPFEHAYATFRISGVSRAMSHQLVRHRLMAVSQKSQRYVSEQAFDYVIPPGVPDELQREFAEDMTAIQGMYRKWREHGLKKEDARFVLPNACTTELIISANFREFRHILRMRCSKHAQWEIRAVAESMLRQLHECAPNTFRDLADQFLGDGE